jgi:uncharacterized membrane protein
MNKLTMTGVAAASAAAAIAALPLMAKAATPVTPPANYQYEKCYGVNAAGKNDCAAQGVHSCGGESKIANDPKSYVYLPTGTCTKIQGGSTAPKA